MPDFVLLDIMMPGMDGYEVCERLKEDPKTKNIPVIFVTAKDQEFDEAKGFEVGAVDYINKPVSPVIVKARVKTQLVVYDQQRELTRQVKEKTKQLDATQLEIIHKLGIAAEFKDNETGLHVIRMSRYCYLISKEFGFDDETSELLLKASPMHDVGKIGIPDHVLLKPGKLTKEEFEIIKTHCDIGNRIIGDSDSELLQVARVVAHQHHEKWNGRGYPQGLMGDDIDIYARITSVADVFDALTSRRPYKEPWELDRAVGLITEESGQQFDPMVVKAFLDTLPQIIEVRDENQND